MKKLLSIPLAALLITGCGSINKVAYINDVDGTESFALPAGYEITIQPADFLAIVVNTENAADSELALSFNGPMMDAGMRGGASAAANSTALSYDRDRRGYLVDSGGDIDFPILGRLHVQDMTRGQLISFIEERIREEGYIANPLVTASFVNLKISVMGEVARANQYAITSDRVTLLDGLSLAGDMTIYGNRRKVRVIREVDGMRTVATLNLNDKDVFNSPYFYLRQNDVVYVEPNKRRAEQSSVSPMWSLGLSTGGLLISVTTLILTIARK